MLKTEQVAYNTGATAPTEPSREGYRFTGWSAAFDKVKGDMEVTALYEKEEAIDKMKDGVTLLNFARGELVDNQAHPAP